MMDWQRELHRVYQHGRGWRSHTISRARHGPQEGKGGTGTQRHPVLDGRYFTFGQPRSDWTAKKRRWMDGRSGPSEEYTCTTYVTLGEHHRWFLAS